MQRLLLLQVLILKASNATLACLVKCLYLVKLCLLSLQPDLARPHLGGTPWESNVGRSDKVAHFIQVPKRMQHVTAGKGNAGQRPTQKNIKRAL